MKPQLPYLDDSHMMLTERHLIQNRRLFKQKVQGGESYLHL
jgi:hypothetical protein